MCLVLFSSYFMVRSPDQGYAAMLALAGGGGLVAAAIVAAAVAHRLLTPWRRVIVATIALAAAAFIGMLTTVADMLAGRIGLLALGGLCLLAIGAAWRFLLAPRRAAP